MIRVSSLNDKNKYNKKRSYQVENDNDDDVFTDEILSKKLRNNESEDDENNDDLNNHNDNNDETLKCDHAIDTMPELTSYNGFILGQKSKTSLFSTIEDETSFEQQKDLENVDDDDDDVEEEEATQQEKLPNFNVQNVFCTICMIGPMLENGIERVVYMQKYNTLMNQYSMGEISTIKLYNSLVVLKQNIDREKDIEENSLVDIMRKCKIEDMYVHIIRDHDRKGARNLKTFIMLAMSDLYSTYRGMEELDLRNYEMLAKILEKFQNILVREGK